MISKTMPLSFENVHKYVPRVINRKNQIFMNYMNFVCFCSHSLRKSSDAELTCLTAICIFVSPKEVCSMMISTIGDKYPVHFIYLYFFITVYVVIWNNYIFLEIWHIHIDLGNFPFIYVLYTPSSFHWFPFPSSKSLPLNFLATLLYLYLIYTLVFSCENNIRYLIFYAWLKLILSFKIPEKLLQPAFSDRTNLITKSWVTTKSILFLLYSCL